MQVEGYEHSHKSFVTMREELSGRSLEKQTFRLGSVGMHPFHLTDEAVMRLRSARSRGSFPSQNPTEGNLNRQTARTYRCVLMSLSHRVGGVLLLNYVEPRQLSSLCYLSWPPPDGYLLGS